MRPGLFACAALLCALPAQGDDTLLSPRVINVLTPIDSVPSKAALNAAFATPQMALDSSVRSARCRRTAPRRPRSAVRAASLTIRWSR